MAGCMRDRDGLSELDPFRSAVWSGVCVCVVCVCGVCVCGVCAWSVCDVCVMCVMCVWSVCMECV